MANTAQYQGYQPFAPRGIIDPLFHTQSRARAGVNGPLGDSLESIWSVGVSDAATAAFQSAGGQAAVAAIVQTSVVAAADAAKKEVGKMLLPVAALAFVAGWVAHTLKAKHA